MTESQIKSVALFFYFTLLDDDLAESASRIVIAKCRAKFKNNKLTENEQLVILVHQLFAVFEKTRTENILNKASLSQKANYLMPQGISFGAWRQFHKESSVEDLVSVVLSQILCLEDATIALGLGVTTGSVRYRVGRGLRQLGHLITLGEIIA